MAEADTTSDLAGSEPGTEPKKPHLQILREEIDEGLTALRRPTQGLFFSGFSAGLDIGFSLFLMAVMRTRTEGILAPPVVDLLVALMYALGFIFVTVGRSELFTEHTTLAVLPVLDRRASVADLARLWGLVYLANLLGAAAFAGLAVLIGPKPMLGVIRPEVFGEIARPVVQHTGDAIFLSAVLAGWMMGLLSWLVTAGRDTISQIVIVTMIATAIGFAGLHHSIVGSVEVLAGVFAEQGLTLGDYGHFLLWTTLGNALGGTFFVAILKYSQAAHAKKTGPEEADQGGRRE